MWERLGCGVSVGTAVVGVGDGSVVEVGIFAGVSVGVGGDASVILAACAQLANNSNPIVMDRSDLRCILLDAAKTRDKRAYIDLTS